MRAAKYLNVPPWELAKQPQEWIALALEFERGEFDSIALRAKLNEDRQAVKIKPNGH